jgi:hypothetical protein
VATIPVGPTWDSPAQVVTSAEMPAVPLSSFILLVILVVLLLCRPPAAAFRHVWYSLTV